MEREEAKWGGQRAGAGRRSTWKSGPCKAVKIPEVLVDQVLQLARQLDEGAALPMAEASEELAILRGENRAMAQRLDELIAERDRLVAELTAVRALKPAASIAATAETPPPGVDAPPDPVPTWLPKVRKQILDLPKHQTRLMVLSLLLNHQAYVAERIRDLERRPPGPEASPRLREEWEGRFRASGNRLQDLAQLFAILPPELVREARSLQVNWGSRAAAGAKRSYKALLERMAGTS
jgi:hypothetical protein